MKQNVNYVNALPDFLAMQRVSFCWFITEGLLEELTRFSKVLDLSQSAEYTILGNEYVLIRPLYNLTIARKYSGNYRAQLVIPTEVRLKTSNKIRFFNQFPSIIFPLMTTHATFVLNGCERVIVSQIIRSPGIYFEKNKNKKKPNKFERKLSTDLTKLHILLPYGEVLLSEFDLFFSVPTTIYSKDKQKQIANWKRGSIYFYSIQSLKHLKKKELFSFLQHLKFYQLLLKQKNENEKTILSILFLKWLKIFTITFYNNFDLKYVKLHNLLTNFYYVSEILTKYFFLEFKKSIFKLKNFPLFSPKKLSKIQSLYKKNICLSQFLSEIELKTELISISHHYHHFFFDFSGLFFFKKSLFRTLTEISIFKIFKNLKPTLYFSTTLKEQLKYIFIKDQLWYNPERHKYLKTKTQLILYKKNHEIKSFYQKKYDTKNLYTAVLVPEYGSWIRLSYQKNSKINLYKYPIKNQENEIVIQLDKITQKPVLTLFKEMGMTDLEINKNLYHADFFYFNNPLLINSKTFNLPLLRFFLTSNYFKDISEFSKIFDPTYYSLGKLGRLKINNRLHLKTSDRLQTIVYDDIFAVIDELIDLSLSKTLPDDIDHLKNRRVRSIGELLQNLFRMGFQRLVRKFRNQKNKIESGHSLNFNIINATIREFFGSSQLSQYLDQTNPLSSLTHRRRISGLGPGGFDRDRISFAVRDIHPSHYGRICPIETPEGQNVGLIASLTTCARVNQLGFLETPFWRVFNGKVLKTGKPLYLTAETEDCYKIAPSDLITNAQNYLSKNVITVRYKQDFRNVTSSEVDFIGVSTVQIVSIAASLIPFFEHDDANRALMGSNMQRQSVPLLFPQKPIIGTGLEHQIAVDSGMILTALKNGVVDTVTATKIIIQHKKKNRSIYHLQKYLRSNQQTCINHRPIVWKGEDIKPGQSLTDGPGVTNGELSLGQNLLIAYMPWQGYNFEDAVLINERLVYENILTSIHIERYKVEVNQNSERPEQMTKIIPNVSSLETNFLNNEGIVIVGTFVKPGDILVGKIKSNNTAEQFPESKLLRAIFGAKAKGAKDSSYRMPESKSGRVVETVTFNRRTKTTYKLEKIYIFVAQIRKIKIGDKIAGRHGNKGIVSRILSRQDMPFLADGTPIDILLNPLGVPSRMNVGQLYECLLGFAGDKLNCRFKVLPFDEMYGLEISRILINKKLRQASIQKNEGWLFNPYAPGKMILTDGRTGRVFENPITVGNAYFLKLIHLVDDKIHARATGPYSLITQQPLRGKAQHGGQRFGEMEVWALEGFGAAFTLKELLTIKSDDMQGRNETLNAIVKGNLIPKFGIPESFKVLFQELRSIGLDISAYRIEKFGSQKNHETEIHLIEKYNASAKTFSPTSNIINISF